MQNSQRPKWPAWKIDVSFDLACWNWVKRDCDVIFGQTAHL